jgi:hypothetical protein
LIAFIKILVVNFLYTNKPSHYDKISTQINKNSSIEKQIIQSTTLYYHSLVQGWDMDVLETLTL